MPAGGTMCGKGISLVNVLVTKTEQIYIYLIIRLIVGTTNTGKDDHNFVFKDDIEPKRDD